MQAVIAILAALVRRATTGEGAYLDVSVADGVLALMALHIDEYLATGDVPHNVLTGRYACYDTYETSDGGWLAVAAIEPRLNGARVLGHRVGLRPFRPQVRVEAEPPGPGPLVVHNYGHGGAGVTLSWGCAREAAALALG